MPVVLPAVEISVLLLALLAIALALIIVKIMQSVGGVFRGIPVVGGYIAGAVESVAQSISGVLGKAERGVDAALGSSWHALAWFMRAWWHQIEAEALADLHMAESLLKLIHAHAALRLLVRSVEHPIREFRHAIKALEREWHGIEAKVKQIERGASKGIDYTARQLAHKALDEYKGIDQLVTKTIPAEISYAEGQTAALGRFIGAIPGIDYLTWAAGIVASVIGLDILNSLRCPSFLSSAKKRGCGLWNGVEDVLGLFVDLFFIADMCDVLPLLEEAYSEVAAPAISALTAAIDAAPCVKGHQPPTLDVPPLYLPAHPGFALSLP